MQRMPALLILILFTFLDAAVAQNTGSRVGVCNQDTISLSKLSPAYTIQLPVDHFHNESRYAPHSNKFFLNRYWINDTWYKPGGPIIVNNGGEDSGVLSLPYMQIGLLHELAKATNGLAVVLEHRYYGESYPLKVKTNADLRFLSLEQAMADQAYFAQHVVFPGHKDKNLTAPNTPWFAVGCSYPGALTAFERVQYPDLFWAALSSSGVTAPVIDNWEYQNVNREYGPPQCTSKWGKIVNIADSIILNDNTTETTALKSLFSEDGTSDINFALSLHFLWFLQFHSWLPCLDREKNIIGKFCAAVSAPGLEYPKAGHRRHAAEEVVAYGGWANESSTLTTAILNYIGFTQGYSKELSAVASLYATDEHDVLFAISAGIVLPQQSWNYQQCTEIGAFFTGDAPADTLPLVSRLITTEAYEKACKKTYNTTWPPNTEPLSRYGYQNVSYSRLFLSGGEEDPWRPLTPLATNLTNPTRLNYSSTPDQPWVLMAGATHCWDMDGSFPSQAQPPASVQKAHEMEIAAFQRWLKEWHAAHPNYDPYVTI